MRGRPAISGLAKQVDLRTYALQYHAEHAPNPESRITLDEKKIDRLGLPQLKINLLFDEADAQSVVQAHDVLDRALRSADKAHLEYWDPPEDRLKNVLKQATDGFHQLGTTRMGMDPKKSVVDRDCRVHGITNLFLASSSVFPTAGHANPTLPATALALRLAQHLAALVKKESPRQYRQRSSPDWVTS
jgi:choline dehydrogenase-like flavoprotein